MTSGTAHAQVQALAQGLNQSARERRQLRSGAMVVPPLVAATLVFALAIIVSSMTSVSPLHLVWWVPCSFIIGLVALIFLLGTRLPFRFLVLFVGPMEGSVRPQRQGGRDARVGRGQRKPRHSTRTLRRTKACRRRPPASAALPLPGAPSVIHDDVDEMRFQNWRRFW